MGADELVRKLESRTIDGEVYVKQADVVAALRERAEECISDGAAKVEANKYDPDEVQLGVAWQMIGAELRARADELAFAEIEHHNQPGFEIPIRRRADDVLLIPSWGEPVKRVEPMQVVDVRTRSYPAKAVMWDGSHSMALEIREWIRSLGESQAEYFEPTEGDPYIQIISRIGHRSRLFAGHWCVQDTDGWHEPLTPEQYGHLYDTVQVFESVADADAAAQTEAFPPGGRCVIVGYDKTGVPGADMPVWDQADNCPVHPTTLDPSAESLRIIATYFPGISQDEAIEKARDLWNQLRGQLIVQWSYIAEPLGLITPVEIQGVPTEFELPSVADLAARLDTGGDTVKSVVDLDLKNADSLTQAIHLAVGAASMSWPTVGGVFNDAYAKDIACQLEHEVVRRIKPRVGVGEFEATVAASLDAGQGMTGLDSADCRALAARILSDLVTADVVTCGVWTEALEVPDAEAVIPAAYPDAFLSCIHGNEHGECVLADGHATRQSESVGAQPESAHVNRWGQRWGVTSGG